MSDDNGTAPIRRVRRAKGGGAPVVRERKVKRYGSRLPVSGTPEAQAHAAGHTSRAEFLAVIRAQDAGVCPQCMDDPDVAYCGRCGRREPERP
jgi:hypothetical protein